MIDSHISFFSQGSYGCTTYPAIKCGDVVPHVRNISKVVKNNFFSKHELEIGKLLAKIIHKERIQKTKPFLYYYKSCPTQREIIKTKTHFYEKCNLFKEDTTAPKHDSFVILYGEYIPSIPNSFFFKRYFTLDNLFLLYSFSLRTISILIRNGIIHMDLHSRNIVVNTKKKDTSPTFHMIDFGLSLKEKTCYQSNGDLDLHYMKYFFTYAPHHQFWSVERHLLCYMIKNKVIPNQSQLTQLMHAIYSKHTVLQQIYQENYEGYKQHVCHYYEKLCNNASSFQSLLLYLFKESCYTWDMYSISYFCLKLMYHHKKQSHEFCHALKKNIHYDFTKRPKIQEQIKVFSILLKTS